MIRFRGLGELGSQETVHDASVNVEMCLVRLRFSSDWRPPPAFRGRNLLPAPPLRAEARGAAAVVSRPLLSAWCERRSATAHSCSTPPKRTRSASSSSPRSSPSRGASRFSRTAACSSRSCASASSGSSATACSIRQPVAGVPKSQAARLGGLMDVVLHPRFAENKLIYLTYSKPRRQRARSRRAGARPMGRRGADRREGSFRGRAVLERIGRGRVAPRVRPRRHALHDDRRVGREPDGRAGARPSQRQGAAPARRWHGAARQSVCRQAPDTSRRFSRSDIAIRSGWPFSPRPARSARTRTAPTAATKST